MTIQILKTVCEVGSITIDSFFPAKYPQAKLGRKIFDIDPAHEFNRATFSAILWRLRKQGLIERKQNKWLPTALGKKSAEKTKFNRFPIAKKDGIARLVIFDIREKERQKRVWLRLELIANDYKLLQKSVWIGYRPLSKGFFETLEDLGLLNSVHIFSINQTGTLESLNTDL